jgi:hypothetical protein
MGGLLPADVSLKTCVITLTPPTLFAPKGMWGGVRWLSGDELLLAQHNWPMFLIDAVSAGCKDFPSLLPEKCLVAGLPQLIGNRGGLLGFGLDKQSAVAKRRRRNTTQDGTEERASKRNCNDLTNIISDDSLPQIPWILSQLLTLWVDDSTSESFWRQLY